MYVRIKTWFTSTGRMHVMWYIWQCDSAWLVSPVTSSSIENMVSSCSCTLSKCATNASDAWLTMKVLGLGFVTFPGSHSLQRRSTTRETHVVKISLVVNIICVWVTIKILKIMISLAPTNIVSKIHIHFVQCAETWVCRPRIIQRNLCIRPISVLPAWSIRPHTTAGCLKPPPQWSWLSPWWSLNLL